MAESRVRCRALGGEGGTQPLRLRMLSQEEKLLVFCSGSIIYKGGKEMAGGEASLIPK